jgi:polypeptide N-acetylgalactosaminyltransferase
MFPFQDIPAGNLSSRIAIKDQCFKQYGRNFSWFLREVFPELGTPGGITTLAWDGVRCGLYAFHWQYSLSFSF